MTHGQRSPTTRPTRIANAKLGVDGVAEPASEPVHDQEGHHSKDDPGDPSNHLRPLHPSGGLAHVAQRT